MELVIGVDAGGTSTRCLVADTDGTPLGTGAAAGLNQHSSGGDPVAQLAHAVAGALDGHDPADVVAGALGVAGAGAAGVDVVRAHAADAWRRVGIAGEPQVVTDLLTAFAAGSPAATGTVLVAGTGAGAAAIVDRHVARQADGAGWLLGDVGSAVWLAREALVAVVAALDGRGPTTALTEPLLGRLLGRPAPYDVQDVIARAYAVPPAALGTLAPVVTDLAAADPVAGEIVARGVAGLLASLDAVRADGPVVLAGALLTHDGPVRDGVVAGLAERVLGAPSSAQHPAAGAAWLALVSRGVTDERVHTTLCAH
ncbi:N-acetylglucosamine kinase [Nocardioides sp. GXQ0305]|uniref:N-acetylglucosamine kinase n=1 Tax=Nocardioides sp. GXQ0305 TaxID=3423912 RepID=UPI003D7F02F5